MRGIAKHAAVPARAAFGGARGGGGGGVVGVRRMTPMQKLAKGRDIARKRVVVIQDDLTPRLLAAQMGVTPSRVLGMLQDLGERAEADALIDADIAEIIAQDLGMRTRRADNKLRDRVRSAVPSTEEMAREPLRFSLRAPIITVMGHIDHGKTTLLDALRGGTNVAQGEAGGITQGVAAFSVAMHASAVAISGDRAWRGEGKAQRTAASAAPEGSAAASEAQAAEAELVADAGRRRKPKGKGRDAGVLSPSQPALLSKSATAAAAVDVMTFIDTPGHALFSSMRKRGSSVTDIVVLVVDGKDGIMPQTRECVKLIVDAGLPCVVATTKCDIIDGAAAVERVGKQLLELGLATEAFGGDVPIVAVSARTGMGLQQLKDALALQAEMLELRADASAQGECVVMDSRVVQGMGSVCDVVVRWGTPRVGDIVVAGDEFGRIKALITDVVGARSLSRRVGGGGPREGSTGAAASEGFALTSVPEVLPGTPVRVLGLKGCPAAGSDMLVVDSEDRARAVLAGRARRVQAHHVRRAGAQAGDGGGDGAWGLPNQDLVRVVPLRDVC